MDKLKEKVDRFLDTVEESGIDVAVIEVVTDEDMSEEDIEDMKPLLVDAMIERGLIEMTDTVKH